MISATHILVLTLCTSIFHFYTLPIFGVYPSLTLLASLALVPFALRRPEALTWGPLRFYLALVASHLVSFLWSQDLYLGVRTIAYLLPFPAIYAASYRLTARAPATTRIIVGMFAATSLVAAALVVVFRVLPEAESQFLHSAVARVFIVPPTVEALHDVAKNNVLDPTKSGGFFVNANVAAALLGSSSFALWGIGAAWHRRWLQAAACVLWSAVFFTGSKAGLALALTLPALAYLVHTATRPHRSLGSVLAGLTTTALSSAVLAAGVVYLATGEFLGRAAQTLGARQLIWAAAYAEFVESPLLGQGFGGWQAEFAGYAHALGLSEAVPPHNTLIYLWSQSGLLATLLGAAFMVSVLGYNVSQVLSRDAEIQALSLGCGFAFLWLFIQGMGTNYGIVGDLHFQPILATSLGICRARQAASADCRACRATTASRDGCFWLASAAGSLLLPQRSQFTRTNRSGGGEHLSGCDYSPDRRY